GARPPGARARAAPGRRGRAGGLRRDPPRPHRERPADDGGPAMTDPEYQACTDASRLLHFLRPRLNERKLRLFVAACFRRAAGEKHAGAVRALVEALEALADGQEAPGALEAARGDLWRARTSNAAQRDPSAASFLSFPLRVTEMIPHDAAAACASYPGAGP